MEQNWQNNETRCKGAILNLETPEHQNIIRQTAINNVSKEELKKRKTVRGRVQNSYQMNFPRRGREQTAEKTNDPTEPSVEDYWH